MITIPISIPISIWRGDQSVQVGVRVRGNVPPSSSRTLTHTRTRISVSGSITMLSPKMSSWISIHEIKAKDYGKRLRDEIQTLIFRPYLGLGLGAGLGLGFDWGCGERTIWRCGS